jgi:SP family galactose:H+ symporter-like MFS transporter
MKKQHANTVIIVVGIIAALAGLLFGIDTGVVNGALELIKKDWNLTTTQLEQITSILSIGAMFGALFSGLITRIVGRKKALLTAAFMFTIFVIVAATAKNFGYLLFARFALGLTVGLSSFAAPLYLSEIAPHKIRGSLIAIYQLAITVGLFSIFLSNAVLARYGSWRLMFAVIVIPSSIMFFSALFLPKSPRWLMLVGKNKEALDTLHHVRADENEINFEFKEIQASLNYKKTTILSLLTNKNFFKLLLLGMSLQLLQQFCGVNAFGYYSTSIFASAGLSNPALGTVIMGAIKVVGSIWAIIYIDRWGRKPILYLGLTISIISLLIIGILFHIESVTSTSSTIGNLMLITTLLFQAGYSISLGPLIWVLCAEIFPLAGRDLGITVTTATNWIGNAILSRYILTMIAALGASITFWIFGGVCVAGLVLVNLFTPETKNVPLEEIEVNLKDGLKLKDLGKRRMIIEKYMGSD